ncbi:pentatricopeptide repeat protein [Geosmithia morbida]|uniref:Pentatricopeptide repeat protein n=1 Tax=Geosmithia morbida TaxID=1094350 RepID=A0A9P4YVH4_9HYPO|nr:pentatricopeptide repeat protein [Geosmithia morbida]KAF4122443.1 pentatricopeptide repeat protein [Geosmithia morbida]
MAARPLLLDLGCRNESICRSCLVSLVRRPKAASAATSWVGGARYISHTAERRARTRSRTNGGESTATTTTRAKKSAFERPTQTEAVQQQQLGDLSEAAGSRGQNVEGESNNFSVRFFEQEGSKLTEIPDDGSYEQGLGGVDASVLRNSFEQMKRVAGSKGEREALDEVLGAMGSNWGQMRTKDDVERAMQRMEKYGASIDAEIEATLAELPEEIRDGVAERFGPLLSRPKFGTRPMSVPSSSSSSSSSVPTHTRFPPPPQIPTQPYTANQRKKISRLNSAMQRVAREMRLPAGLTDRHVSTVYRAYHAARLSLASNWAIVPLPAWDLLWSIFAADESVNAHRLTHVSLLARDMGDARVPLSPAQQLLTIEAIFVEGWEGKALESWKRCMPSLGAGSAETFRDFWELGVRMSCRVGDMDQAQRCVDRLVGAHSDPRILMPVIRTWSERGTARDHDRAWLAYRRMRDLLGRSMKLADYDQVVSYFLTTNQTDNALHAFVDMMSDGQVDLRKQKYLPSVVANKFFVGKWLKRLIGAGDLDGAYSVVDFMRRKGVEASPIHLNGLVGAWQRSGTAASMDKAERLAWDMIGARIDFVRSRKEKGVTAAATAAVPKKKNKDDVAPFPRATLETFSLLAENYRLRGLHDRMVELWDSFRDAEISPDAFMMNQLLESYIQAGQAKEARALYDSLVSDRGIVPDPYTFSALWKTLDINRLHHVPSGALADEAVAARSLFAEAARFRSIFSTATTSEDGQGSGDGSGGVGTVMDGQLGRKILHTFRRIGDNAGFLVALTSLRQLFGFMPSEALVLELTMGTTRLSWDSPPQRRRLIAAKRQLDSDLLAHVDGDASRLGDETTRSNVLYEYLQRRYWPSDGADNHAKVVFLETAREMGVYQALVAKGKGGEV